MVKRPYGLFQRSHIFKTTFTFIPYAHLFMKSTSIKIKTTKHLLSAYYVLDSVLSPHSLNYLIWSTALKFFVDFLSCSARDTEIDNILMAHSSQILLQSTLNQSDYVSQEIMFLLVSRHIIKPTQPTPVSIVPTGSKSTLPSTELKLSFVFSIGLC